jgi:hypothetical protein
VCFDTQGKSVEFEYLKINIFSRATLLMLIHEPGSNLHHWLLFHNQVGPPLNAVGAAHTTHPGLLLTL